MRRRLTLALLPALLLAGGSPSAAATKPIPEPGTIIIHKTSPVVQYRLLRFDPIDISQGDGGTVRVDYTCYPSLTDTQPETVEMLVSVGTTEAVAFGAFAGRDGVQAPCDGTRHTLDVSVNRGTDSPFNPHTKRASGSVALLIFDCECADPLVTEYSAPTTIVFQGFKDLPF